MEGAAEGIPAAAADNRVVEGIPAEEDSLVEAGSRGAVEGSPAAAEDIQAEEDSPAAAADSRVGEGIQAAAAGIPAVAADNSRSAAACR